MGSDQKRSPRILDDGTIDTNDTTLRQYHNFLEAEAMRKKDAEDTVGYVGCNYAALKIKIELE